MKYKVFLAILFTFFFFQPTAAHANSFDSIDIDVVLQEDGSAVVTEHRIFEVTDGTEQYLPFPSASLGPSEIKDFSVTEQGKPMENVGAWDIDLSLEEKAGKYGILETDDGVELCFGVGQLGKRDFTVTYTLTNFVRQLTDGKQAVYWEFVHPDQDEAGEVNLTIRNSVGFEYSQENTKIWGFGYFGETEITPTALTATTSDGIDREHYMVVLAIMPEGTFATEATSDHSSQSIEELAKEGSDWENLEDSGASGTAEGDSGLGDIWRDFKDGMGGIAGLIGAGVKLLLFAIPVYLFLKFGIKFLDATFMSMRSPKATGYSPTEVDHYHRDVPYPGPPIDVSGLIRHKTEDLMAAVFLEWVREGRLIPLSYEKGLIFKQEKTGLQINFEAGPAGLDPRYLDLWNGLVSAAGKNGVLEANELSNYVYRHPGFYSGFKSRATNTSTEFLQYNKLIEERTTKKYSMTIRTLHPTPAGQQMINNAAGFKRYLLDFSLMSEREAINVLLWDDFMIWAAFLGIAEKVRKQFNMVDPTYENCSPMTVETVTAVGAFSHAAYSGYESYKSSLEHSSSGGGGSSSSGGGGGAGGSASGGGTR